MSKRRVLNCALLLAVVPSLIGCVGLKCVKVVDERGGVVSGASLEFSAYRTPNDNRYGGLISHVDHFYKKEVGVTDSNGEICFSDHKEEDSYYLYKDLRVWRFQSGGMAAHFETFSSIPEVVVLESLAPVKEEAKKRRELIEKELRITTPPFLEEGGKKR